MPPHMLFAGEALAAHVGSALAVLLFARIQPVGVTLLRVVAAAAVMAIWQRPWQIAWTAARVRVVCAMGIALTAMNTCFYLAIDRLPLGTAVALEFAGPVVVVALGSRTRRDVAALATAAAGVVLLSDPEVSGDALGVAFALAAGWLWACYIVIAHRAVADPALGAQRGLAAAMVVGAVALVPFGAAQAWPAFVQPGLLLVGVGVGLLGSVVPYLLDLMAMARLPRARYALMLALLPAIAVLVGFVLLGQVPSVPEAVGISLVGLATALRSHEP